MKETRFVFCSVQQKCVGNRHPKNERKEFTVKKIKIGVIGLGGRGLGLLKDAILPRENVEVIALSDLYPDRMEDAAKAVQEASGITPELHRDYHEILRMESVEAVVIPAAWEAHIPIAVEAMRAGKIVGCEVGGAYSLQDCWELVKTQEATGTPCMMLENCCYGREELMALNMVKKGVLGTIIHCQGGYHHDLRDEISFGRENRHYRLRNYMNRNCENYPTHELGPIAKILNINRGNRMVSLTSTASRAAGLNEFLKREKGDDYDIANYPFAQGDVVTTVIKCAHGETIVLTLDTTLPRFYSRGFEVRGTKGMYTEDTRSIFLDGIHNKYDFDWKPMWNNVEEYRKEFEHPIWRKNLEDGVRGGHGGMDWLEFDAFFTAIAENRPMPVDVYDMAAWMAITPLSEQAIATGAPQSVPDFTNGLWTMRKEEPCWHFGLANICEE